MRKNDFNRKEINLKTSKTKGKNYSFHEESKIVGQVIIKKREAHIRADLYCVFKNAFKKRVSLNAGVPPPKYEFKDIAIQYPTGLPGKRKYADLVVIANVPLSHFLVIEVKRRGKYPGRSLKSATRQAETYAEKLNCPFFAVTDGFIMIVFWRVPEYLIGACKVEMTEIFATNLLRGLVEYYEKRTRTMLRELPKPPDPYFLFERLLTPIAKFFAKKEGSQKGATEGAVKVRTRQLRLSWMAILRRDLGLNL